MTTNPTELRARLRALPKVDLHRHLEGALRPETLWEFHQKQGERLHASLAALRAALVIPDGERPGFAGFLERFAALRFAYGGVGAWERLAREAVADAADDGIVHLELRFSPVFWARRMAIRASPNGPLTTEDAEGTEEGKKTDRESQQARQKPSGGRAGTENPCRTPEICRSSVSSVPSVSSAVSSSVPLPPELVEEAAEGVIRGARDEAARRGISVTFLLSLGRHFGADANRPAAQLLYRPVGAAFAGLDVAGDETVSLAPLAGQLAAWRAAGRPLTLHAGEAPEGPGAAGVREAIAVFGATRIGHGVRAAEDPAVVELLRQRGTPLEVCLTSNVQTHAARSFEEHPLPRLLAAGVHVTLNSDDPAICGSTLTEEYARAHERCGMSFAALRQLAVNTAAAAFLPGPEREALVRRVAEAWEGRTTGGMRDER